MGAQKPLGWIHSADGKHYQLHDRLAMLEGIDMEQEVQAELCTLGIPREPWDFVDRAIKAGHPRSLAIHLSGDVMEMLKQNFAEGALQGHKKGEGKFSQALDKPMQRT